MKFRFSLSHLKAPTPPMMVKLGNALVAVSTGTSIPLAMAGHPWIAAGIFWAGAIGRFLSSFFVTDAVDASQIKKEG